MTTHPGVKQRELVLTRKHPSILQTPPGDNLGRAFLASVGFDHGAWWRSAAVGVFVAYIIGLNLVNILCFKFFNGEAETSCTSHELSH